MTICCVPHCPNKSRKNWKAYICSRHWPAVDRKLKRELRLAVRNYRRQFGMTVFYDYPPGSDERIDRILCEHVWDAAWNACVANAIERAVGIG